MASYVCRYLALLPFFPNNTLAFVVATAQRVRKAYNAPFDIEAAHKYTEYSSYWTFRMTGIYNRIHQNERAKLGTTYTVRQHITLDGARSAE
jgi:sugar (pentulose or hexulose) kinase